MSSSEDAILFIFLVNRRNTRVINVPDGCREAISVYHFFQRKRNFNIISRGDLWSPSCARIESDPQIDGDRRRAHVCPLLPSFLPSLLVVLHLRNWQDRQARCCTTINESERDMIIGRRNASQSRIELRA